MCGCAGDESTRPGRRFDPRARTGQTSKKKHECLQPRPSVDEHEERLAFLDDVGGELGRIAAADVAHRVDRLGGDQQDLAGVEARGLVAVDGVLERPFKDVDNLLPRCSGRKLDVGRRRVTDRTSEVPTSPDAFWGTLLAPFQLRRPPGTLVGRAANERLVAIAVARSAAVRNTKAITSGDARFPGVAGQSASRPARHARRGTWPQPVSAPPLTLRIVSSHPGRCRAKAVGRSEISARGRPCGARRSAR